MYLAHFGLKEFPFGLTPDTGYFFPGVGAQSALNTLLVALESGEGLIKIVGEVGSGKTLLCRYLLNHLESQGWAAAYVPNPHLTPAALNQALLGELAGEAGGSVKRGLAHGLTKALELRLLELARAGKPAVALIDEAQAMPLETLEALRLITNLETEKRKLLQIVLFGQPELDTRLAEPSVRQIRGRIVFHERIQPLSARETPVYLMHRATQAGAAATSTATSGGVTILADAASNSLVINAPDHLYNSLRVVIDKLDAQRAQVFVEALIVEVSSAKAAELGIQWQTPLLQNQDSYALLGGTNFGSGGNNLLALSSAIATGTVSSLPGAGLNLALGQTVTLNGEKVTGLTALARLLESDGDANILSTPNLLTLDNEEAKIVIGQNVPFITGQYAQTASTGSSSSVSPFQTIERKDVGLTLKVKPQVSEGGTIKLQIVQEVSNVQDASNAAGIITNKRSIETTVLVGDGDAIVLGGLIQDDVQNGIDKVPGLGDLPLIGGLFRSETRKRTKTNLMVFLRPVVVRTPEALAGLTDTRYDYIRNVYGAFPVTRRLLLPDNSPGALPDLKLDGVLAGKPPVRTAPPAPVKKTAPERSSNDFSIWPE